MRNRNQSPKKPPFIRLDGQNGYTALVNIEDLRLITFNGDGCVVETSADKLDLGSRMIRKDQTIDIIESNYSTVKFSHAGIQHDKRSGANHTVVIFEDTSKTVIVFPRGLQTLVFKDSTVTIGVHGLSETVSLQMSDIPTEDSVQDIFQALCLV